MVVTGKARSKIRSSMKEERRRQGNIGKEALERKLKSMKADFDDNVDLLVKYFDLNSHVDLYFEIAMDRIQTHDLKDYFKVEGGKLVEIEHKEDKQETSLKKPAKSRRKKYEGKPRLLVNGEPADQYNYMLASCCNPVMGDDVFAYTTINAGLKIHRTSCPNATNLMARYGYRIMKAEWVASGDASFVADLLITGIDDGPGVIERLTRNISSDLGLNIRSFSIEGHEGYFEGKMSLLVPNKDQLNIAIRALQNLDGLSSVTRIES
jgi:GTP pyrophosphokinase